MRVYPLLAGCRRVRAQRTVPPCNALQQSAVLKVFPRNWLDGLAVRGRPYLSGRDGGDVRLYQWLPAGSAALAHAAQ
jgi:hypothetical protein